MYHLCSLNIPLLPHLLVAVRHDIVLWPSSHLDLSSLEKGVERSLEKGVERSSALRYSFFAELDLVLFVQEPENAMYTSRTHMVAVKALLLPA